MTKPKTDQPRKAGESPNFEKALAELEDIVGRMESGKLGLEEMIQHFEKGQALVKFCTAKLNEVEQKIEVLVKKGEEIVAEPFEPEDGAEGQGGSDKGRDPDGLF